MTKTFESEEDSKKELPLEPFEENPIFPQIDDEGDPYKEKKETPLHYDAEHTEVWELTESICAHYRNLFELKAEIEEMEEKLKEKKDEWPKMDARLIEELERLHKLLGKSPITPE